MFFLGSHADLSASSLLPEAFSLKKNIVSSSGLILTTYIMPRLSTENLFLYSTLTHYTQYYNTCDRVYL